MNGQAIVIGTIHGGGYRVGSITANAVTFGAISASGTSALKTMTVNGSCTQETGLKHWINVMPTDPQLLVWLTPQVGIDYTVTTSSKLDWDIE